MCFGLPDVHLAALEVVEARDLTWLKFLMVDLKKGQAGSLFIEGGEEMRKEVGLVFETPEESDGEWTLVGMLTHASKKDVGSDLGTGGGARVVIEGTKAFAHGLAKRGFIVHEVCALSSLGVDSGAVD